MVRLEDNGTSLFKLGDVVKLRSGGPSMTVNFIEMQGFSRVCITTVWLDIKDRLQRANFYQEALRAE